MDNILTFEQSNDNSATRYGGSIRLTNVPVGYMMEGLKRYLEEGIEPGNFLYSLLSNDLQHTFAHADEQNSVKLKQWVQWCYNELPVSAWGSPERVDEWMRQQSRAETRWTYTFV